MNYGYYSAEDYYPIENAYTKRTIELFQSQSNGQLGESEQLSNDMMENMVESTEAVPVPVPDMYLMPTMTGNQIILPATGSYIGPFLPTFILSPTNVKAKSDKDGNVTVTFSKPVFSQGIDVIGYTVYSIPGDRMEESTKTSVVFQNMEKNKKYTFVVVAKTTIGNSAPSSPSSQIIVADKMSKLSIIAIIVCSLLVGLAILYGLYYLYKKYQKNYSDKNPAMPQTAQITQTNEVTAEPTQVQTQVQTKPSPLIQKFQNFFKFNKKNNSASNDDITTESSLQTTPETTNSATLPFPTSTQSLLTESPSSPALLNSDIKRDVGSV